MRSDRYPEIPDFSPTAEQRETAHPFEGGFSRESAWVLENLFRYLAHCADSSEEFDDLLHGFGQGEMDVGRHDIAKRWAHFLVAKKMAAVKEDSSDVLAKAWRQMKAGQY